MADGSSATSGPPARRAWSPGRVNLIGEHTDYTGGLVMPMAIDLGITAALWPDGRRSLRIRSSSEPAEVELDLPVTRASGVAPAWGRYVAGVAAELDLVAGGALFIDATLPPGAGLSSSAALELAVALALGFDGTAVELAERCRRAEISASGVPCGIMDQLACAAGVDGHALLIDCGTLDITPVELPHGAAVAIVHSGVARRLAGSAYSDRVRECAAAEEVVGPLRSAAGDAWRAITEPVAQRRARHVIGENARVLRFADALRRSDLVEAGRLMGESHASLRDDYEVSLPSIDALVERLAATPGVHGARLTGAGFGGCVVALCDAACDPRPPGSQGWMVRPSAGARLLPPG